MNSPHDKQLERAVDRALKSLPELSAPDTLLSRVMAALGSQPVLPWYRRPWPTWPVRWRAVSFAVLLVVFGALCFGGIALSRQPWMISAMSEPVRWVTDLGVFCNLLQVLGQVVFAVVQKLGTRFMVACALVAASSYCTCIGLGTVLVRFVWPRRSQITS